MLRAAPVEDTATLLIEAARELHAEIGGNLVDDLCAATSDQQTETRRFTGSRVVVEVAPHTVTFDATRGRATLLLDRTSTPRLELPLAVTIPWFQAAIGPTRLEAGEIRGPLAGERIETDDGSKPIHDVLAEAGVPPSDRWSWPCLFSGGTCLAVLGIRNSPRAPRDLLPRVRLSGIFDSTNRF